MKSSNTFCLCSSMPLRCQSSPYSLPPRRFGIANTPPRSTHNARDAEKPGVWLTLKPP
jgi:hypothetical protein